MLLGRERELEQLKALLDQGRPVAVLGEAGVGKTTLVREALRAGGCTVFEGGGLATLSWLPYLPFRRALGRDVSGGDAANVAAEVERAVSDGILFLDDLHWADADTLAALTYLVERVALVSAVRRGDSGAPAALERLKRLGCQVLDLEPLGPEAATLLARRVRPELGDASLRRLVESSGGNPLLVEELAATGTPSESLKLALRARLRLLSSSAREGMGLLSLAGRPLEARHVGVGLGELVDAGLVVLDGGTASVRHALLGEVAGETLEDEERRTSTEGWRGSSAIRARRPGITRPRATARRPFGRRSPRRSSQRRTASARSTSSWRQAVPRERRPTVSGSRPRKRCWRAACTTARRPSSTGPERRSASSGRGLPAS